MKIAAFFLIFTYVSAYGPVEKEQYLPGILLDELADRMRKESEATYLDIGNSNLLGSRSLEEEQYDPLEYDLGDALYHPSIRDQEYLRHSSLLGSSYADDGTSGGVNHFTKPSPNEVKAKNSLPAYCNPPNPCPVGYVEAEGCLESFSNTATFSRRYQEEQDCMCDTEHMFDCPDTSDPILDNSMDSLTDFQFDKYMRQQMQVKL